MHVRATDIICIPLDLFKNPLNVDGDGSWKEKKENGSLIAGDFFWEY